MLRFTKLFQMLGTALQSAHKLSAMPVPCVLYRPHSCVCVCAEFPHDTGIMSGPYDNPFDDGSWGTEYIQNIEDLPQYDWTYGQADDMCPDCTPTTLAE